jgi:HD-GYP domain-containing protein (c-di-GMP phosphodiesterase class II)
MTSDRTYRKALPQERAIAELRRASGSQFDPVVVETLLASLDGYAASASGAGSPKTELSTT